jgi:hypothetical protein
MGRHTEAATTGTGLRRTASLAGLGGGLLWAATALLGDGSVADVLLRVGGVLITVALVGLGLLLVKSELLVLRIFVGIAVPILVWGVVALLRDSSLSTSGVDAVFGGVVALVSAVRLAPRRGPR